MKYLRAQKQQQKVLSYRSIVVDIAFGGEPSPGNVERILAETGKTIVGLQRDVERHDRRTTLKALVASIPKLEQEYDQLQHQSRILWEPSGVATRGLSG